MRRDPRPFVGAAGRRWEQLFCYWIRLKYNCVCRIVKVLQALWILTGCYAELGVDPGTRGYRNEVEVQSFAYRTLHHAMVARRDFSISKTAGKVHEVE